MEKIDSKEKFIFLAVLVWFYGFFHARNLAAYDEGPIYELHDEFIWESLCGEKHFEISNPAVRKWCAIALIVIGAVMMWGTLEDVIFLLIPEHLWRILSPIVDLVPQLAVSAFIIYLGVKMIMGKKEEMNSNGNEN